MNYRLSVWRANHKPDKGPLWEATGKSLFPRYEVGDIIQLKGFPSVVGEDELRVVRVEHALLGLEDAPGSQEIAQDVYIDDAPFGE